jgi:hypothetical protein
VKFLGAQRDAYVEPQRFRPQDRESRLRVADEILLRDPRARPKRVAAEEDVATNDPPLCAGEKIIAPPFVEILRVEIIRSRQRGAYSDGSVIGTQPCQSGATPLFPRKCRYCRSERRAAARCRRRTEPPEVLIAQNSAELLLQLAAPALRFGTGRLPNSGLCSVWLRTRKSVSSEFEPIHTSCFCRLAKASLDECVCGLCVVTTTGQERHCRAQPQFGASHGRA